MSKSIVLAHGIFGFGTAPILSSFANYFNGVKRFLEDLGHNVIAPTVSLVGSVAERGEELAAQIAREMPGDEIHIIAHSMGGLDARFALANSPKLAARVKTLVMIGTPNRGSPVADAIANRTDPAFQALLQRIPDFLQASLENNASGLHDLTTEAATAFDEAHRDRKGIRYIEVSGVVGTRSELLLFRLAEEIGNLRGEPNDGVVTRSSALLHGDEQLDDWPVDHAGEIGWTFPFLSAEFPIPFHKPPHLARYAEIVNML